MSRSPFVIFVLLWALLALLSSSSKATVVINEIMASNGSTIADEDGDFEDWIELVNTGDTSLDISHWGLSDRSETPFKWIFPEGVALDPGEFLLVWASGKNRTSPTLSPSTIVPSGAEWRFLEQAGNKLSESNWNTPHFNDADWHLGAAPFGFGAEFNGNTNISAESSRTAFRREFQVEFPAHFNGLQLELNATAGAVVYINGHEVLRHLMPDGPITADTQPLGIPAQGLVLWVTSGEGLVTREEDGEVFVSQWTDISGNGNHLFQLTTTHQPRLHSNGPNGRPSLLFEGANQRLVTAPLETGGEITLFVVAKAQGGSSFARILSKGSDAAGWMLMRSGTSANAALRLDTSAGFNQVRSGGALFDNTWHHLSLAVSAHDALLRNDGVTDIVTTFDWGAGPESMRPLVLGANYFANGGFLAGEIAEVVLYDRRLDHQEILVVERMLDLKYGRPSAPATVSHVLDESFLQPGTNVVAVDLRQHSSLQDFLHFDLKLSGLKPRQILHTNFSLASSGEPIVLSRPDGIIADAISAVRVPRDVSYGREPDGSGDWFFFSNPSPAYANQSPAYIGVLDPPLFSHDAGFYNEAFALSLGHHQGEVTIVYSVDGSTPSLESVDGVNFSVKYSYPVEGTSPLGEEFHLTKQSSIYSDPILISRDSMAESSLAFITTIPTDDYSRFVPSANPRLATVVRARAFKAGFLPSEAIAHTYILDESLKNASLPIVSTTIDADFLFDQKSGIMVPGEGYENWRLSNPQAPPNFTGSNFLGRGDDWEQLGNLEIIRNGSAIFSQPTGFRIHGNATRVLPAKSLRASSRKGYFREEFSGRIFDGLVGAQTGQPLSSHVSLVLRSGGNFAFATRIRDALFLKATEPLGLLRTAYTPAIHLINGELWGLYEIRERLDEHFMSAHLALPTAGFTMLSNDGHLRHGRDESAQKFQDVKAYIIENDMSDDTHYSHVDQLIDLRNFALYYAIQIYGGNIAWPTNNIEFWRVENEFIVPGSPTHDGRWRWMLYDLDYAWSGAPSENSLAHALDPPTHWGRVKINNLLQNVHFRNLFINHFCTVMNSVFKAERVNSIIDELNTEIAPYYYLQSLRWPTSSGIHVAGLKNYSANRGHYIRQFLRERFGLAGEADLTLEAAGPSEAGHVVVNDLLITPTTPGLPDPANPYPWTGTYFQGVPVKITALPEPGYGFAGWQELPGEESDEITVTLTGDATFTAIFEPVAPPPTPVDLHGWNFDDSASYLDPSLTVASGSLVADPGPGSAVVHNGPDAANGFPTGHLRVNNPPETVLTFHLPTTGYENITVSYDTRRSNAGATRQVISYSLDGDAFIELASIDVLAEVRTHQFDFSSIEGSADNSAFRFRIEIQQGSGGTGGNNRFDNFTVSGTALPGVNQPPAVNPAALPAGPLIAGSDLAVDLQSIFTDPDGDSLSFSVESSRPLVADGIVENGALTLQALAAGETTVTFSADDGSNAPVSAQVTLLVYPEAHKLADGSFAFTEWDALAPNMTFPDHMIFLQSEVNDPVLDTPLERAYQIPPGDAAVATDADLPYNAASRTRINGLGGDGISFINTGRGRDVGSALVALDTTGLTGASISFTAGTILANSRVYAIRLQYRVGDDGTFVDVEDSAGNPVEYVRGANGQVADFGPIALPADALDEPYVQLQWKYYSVSGSGSRPQMRLDNIFVTGAAEVVGASALAFATAPQLWVQEGVALGPVTVTAVDDNGLADPSFDGAVTVALVGDGTLGGTLTVQAVNGVAVFDDLTVTGTPGGFSFTATADTLTSATSAGFKLSDAAVFLPGGNGSWPADANWTSSAFPEGGGARAFIPSSVGGDRNVNIDAPLTIGSLRVNHASSAARNRIRDRDTGNSLTWDNGGSTALLRIDGSGTGYVEMENAAGTALADDLEIQVNAIEGHPEFGALRLRETWSGPGGLTKTGPGLASLTGGGKIFTGPVVINQGVLLVTEPAAPSSAASLTVLPGGQLRLNSASSDTAPVRQYAFGGPVFLQGSGRSGVSDNEGYGILGALRYEPGSSGNIARLANDITISNETTIHVATAGNTLVLDGQLSGTGTLVKTGGGQLALASMLPNTPEAVSVATGSLLLQGSDLAAPVDIAPTARLSGFGSTGEIRGEGGIDLDHTTLTAPSTGATLHRFVFRQIGSANPLNAAASGNAVLRLTGTAPFAPSGDSIPRIDLFINTPVAAGDRLRGGFFTPQANDLLSTLQDAEVQVWLADPAGQLQHRGASYRPVVPDDQIEWRVVAETVPFTDQIVDGAWIEVFSPGTTTSFGQWRRAYFGYDDSREDNVSGPGADPYSRGQSNLLRYAFNLDPEDFFPGALSTLSRLDSRQAIFSFPIDVGKTDLIYRITASPNLLEWDDVLYDSRFSPLPEVVDGWLQWPVDLRGTQKYFYRLELEIEQE